MPKADTSVKWFHSDMPGAPVLRGEPGALIELLDACLISGFDPRTPDSITVAGEVATVTLSGGNPYDKHAVVAITGASVAALNAEWRIATSSAAAFTFACPGIPDGGATGATIKRAAAGWGKPHSDTQKAVYRSLHPLASGVCLRIDDSDARYPRVRGYEDMTGIDVGTNPFPTFAQHPADQYWWGKSDTASAAARPWTLVADGLYLWYLPAWFYVADSPPPLHRFGDFRGFDPSTTHPVLISAYNSVFQTFSWWSGYATNPDDTPGVYAPRDFVTNSYGPASRRHHSAFRGWRTPLSPPPSQSPAYPAYIVNGESFTSSAAGQAPGILWVPDQRTDWGNRTVIEAGGSAFLRVQVIYSSTEPKHFVLFDITGPWR